MFNRRRLPLVAAGACLLLASGAAAVEGDAFTATSTPSHVKPTASASYTITLTNDSLSPNRGQRAKIAIPPGFVVDPATVQAISEALGGCDGSTWEPDGDLIANSKINLKRPGGNATGLCQGAKLTVSFNAISPQADGTHPWATQLFIEADEFTLIPPEPTVVVDGTAPEVTINGPSSPSNDETPTFTFSANEPAQLACTLDGVPVVPCTSPQTLSDVPDGERTFTVAATDPAGNTGQNSHTWTLDAIAPNTTFTSPGPPTPTNRTSASFTFDSTEDGSTFQCSLDAVDAGAFTACASPKPYAGLPGGARTFRVRATDTAGNTDASPAAHTWTIDLIGAATTILTAPPSSTNSTSASFTFTSSEAGTEFECSLDGALFTACNSPTAYGNLADGPHTFAVRAIDQADNTGPEASHTWTIDSRPPTAAVTSGPAALSNSRSATFAFSADEPSSFQCWLDGGSLAPCSSPASYQGLGDGAHTFVARPTDAVGNTGASSSYSWTIDATAPETTLGSGPGSGTTALSATFTFSASEPAAFQCRLDGAAFAPCTSPKSHAGLTRSAHSFEVRAIDAAGNPDATPAVHRWTIAAAPRRAKTTSALLAPRAGARVTSPPRLVWRRLAGASYYNVQLYRGRVKVLSSWPTRTHLQLRARWTYLGRQRRLSPGTYRWYVWPGYGRPSARRYGRLLGQSSFTMKAPARR